MLYILYQSSVFDQVAQLIKYSIVKSGLNPVIVTNVAAETIDDDYYIILGANDLVGNLPKHYEVFQFEQVNADEKNWFTGESGEEYIKILQSATRIYDYSPLNSKLLAEKYSLTAEPLPLAHNDGLHVKLNDFNQKKNRVIFFGSMNSRREDILNSLEDQEITVNLEKNVWRMQKDTLIRKNRIALNIHFYANATLETTRLIELLANGILVISEHSTDPVLDEQFKDMVIFSEQETLAETIKYWQNQSADEINSYLEQAMEKFKSTEFVYPVTEKLLAASEPIRMSDRLPETDGQPFAKPDLTIDQNEQVHLKLKKLPEFDDMPPVSVVTITRNRTDFFKLAIANWRNFKYPESRMEWVIVDDSPTNEIGQLIKNIKYVNYIHIPSEKPMSIAAKRNLAVENTKYDIIAHMDDDDYYYPISLLSRVKLLVTNRSDRFYCVGSPNFGVYHIVDNYSFRMITNQMPEASLCYYKSFWAEQKFKDHVMGEGTPFLKNRREHAMSVPFEFNFVAITHQDNYTQKLRSLKEKDQISNNIYKKWSFETQRLINSIYRKISRDPVLQYAP